MTVRRTGPAGVVVTTAPSTSPPSLIGTAVTSGPSAQGHTDSGPLNCCPDSAVSTAGPVPAPGSHRAEAATVRRSRSTTAAPMRYRSS